MAIETATLKHRLCQAGSPRDFLRWADPENDGCYVKDCQATLEDVPELISIACKWSGPLGADARMLPVLAWRTLADLGAEAAIEPLIEMVREFDGEYDDWSSEELPDVFGKIGPASIETLHRVAANPDEWERVRSMAAHGLGCVVKHCPDTRDEVTPLLTQLMADVNDDAINYNSLLMVELLELGVVEAAEPIERAFAADRIDLGMAGDWETIRDELGVEGLGLEMPSDPHDSMAPLKEMRKAMLSALAPPPVRRAPLLAAPPEKIGRNDPCPCGSGKKYKKCCLRSTAGV